MYLLTSAVRTSLLRSPDIRIVSDGKDFGKALDFVKRIDDSITGSIQDKAIRKAVERLNGIAAIGLNVRFIDGRDLAQFDAIIEKYNVLVEKAPKSGLTEHDFAFFSAYSKLFDADYFLAGKTSAFKNYDWAYYNPDITRPRVEAIIQTTPLELGSKVLDFGCAVGFYVQSFLEKGFDARGIDISRYAIEHARPDIKKYLLLLNYPSLLTIQHQIFDLVLVKDVLEHIPELILPRLWAILANIGRALVITVPVVNGERGYVNTEDEEDFTHVVRKDIRWWMNLLGPNTRPNDDLCIQLKGNKAKGTLCATVRGETL